MLVTRVRFRPDMYTSMLEAQVMGESGDGTTGTVVLAVEAIQWDTADIPDITAIVPGDPAAERYITTVHKGTIQLDVPVLAAMTAPNRLAALQAALDGWGTANSGLITALGKIMRTARRMNPRAIA